MSDILWVQKPGNEFGPKMAFLDTLILDVQFGEDANRTRQHHAPETLALIRRMALNGIRHNGPAKDSLRRRQLRASLNDDYRTHLIFGPQRLLENP